MRNEIVEKLKKYSHEPPKEEADVVYIIIQVGKIVESQIAEEDFPALRFYRNWVAHYQLDRSGNDGRNEMFDKLNRAVLSADTGDSSIVLKSFTEAISLNRLHRELAKFFKANGLERLEFDYVNWFKQFDELLVRVLIDLPLLPPNDAGYVFTEFRFSRPMKTNDLEFEVKLANGTSLGGKIAVSVNGRFNFNELP